MKQPTTLQQYILDHVAESSCYASELCDWYATDISNSATGTAYDKANRDCQTAIFLMAKAGDIRSDDLPMRCGDRDYSVRQRDDISDYMAVLYFAKNGDDPTDMAIESGLTRRAVIKIGESLSQFLVSNDLSRVESIVDEMRCNVSDALARAIRAGHIERKGTKHQTTPAGLAVLDAKADQSTQIGILRQMNDFSEGTE